MREKERERERERRWNREERDEPLLKFFGVRSGLLGRALLKDLGSREQDGQKDDSRLCRRIVRDVISHRAVLAN
jgi:hypothetical protein